MRVRGRSAKGVGDVVAVPRGDRTRGGRTRGGRTRGGTTCGARKRGGSNRPGPFLIDEYSFLTIFVTKQQLLFIITFIELNFGSQTCNRAN